MALAGELPPDASTASTGLGLNYIGKHCYAYAKDHSAESTTFNLLSFVTGSSGYIVGDFTFFGLSRLALVDVGGTSTFRVQFNGRVVAQVKIDTNDKAMPSQGFWKCIIPPQTIVLVEANTAEDTGNETLSATFSGRVYDA